jgi:hypothetical protein
VVWTCCKTCRGSLCQRPPNADVANMARATIAEQQACKIGCYLICLGELDKATHLKAVTDA